MLPNWVQDGSGWEPPLPLILAAWATTPHLPKMVRLRQHIEYAAKHGVLAEVDQFLRDLGPDDWHYASWQIHPKRKCYT